ncbi:hypothetical protein Tco_0942300 [Tanacetum coccineum]
MSKLLEDVRNINEELSEFINSPSWNRPTFYNDDDDEYTVIYREHKEITPDLPIEEPDNSLSMRDEHFNTISETEKFSVENLVPIPSEFKVISEDICDMPSCDNDHFDVEFGLINSLLSRDISITSPNIDFLPEEFVGELDFIDLILPGTDEDDFDEDNFDEDDFDEDDFDEEEGEINNNILQIEDEILHDKLLNVNLLVNKIEALKLTPSIPFVLEYPSSSPIPVMDSDFLVEEVDTFLIPEDSIPPSIESDLDSEGDIVFLNNLLNEDLIPEYERFTFDIKPDAPVINNFDELNEDECFDLGGGVKTPFLTPESLLRAGGISSGYIKLVYNEELRAEVQLTVEHNVLANEQQHTMQSEPIYDTYMLEKVDSNTTHDSTNMTPPHYLPKVREYVLAKPHHVIAHGSSRNSHEESYGSNDMAPNHYLEEERKKTQERNRNLKSGVMHTTSLQNTTNGRIFKTVGLRWVPTGKIFTSSTTKVDCEPPNGSNEDITNLYECEQTLNVSAGTLNLSVDNTSGLAPQRKERCTLQCALS